MGDQEVTLDDLYMMDIAKLDRWHCLIQASASEWVEVDDEDDVDEEDDDEEDEEEEGEEEEGEEEEEGIWGRKEEEEVVSSVCQGIYLSSALLLTFRFVLPSNPFSVLFPLVRRQRLFGITTTKLLYRGLCNKPFLHCPW